MEVKPGLADLIKSIIAEHTIIERGFYGGEVLVFPPIEMGPLKTVEEGGIYGVKVLCSRDALKEIYSVMLSSTEPYLIETHVFSSEEPVVAVFILNVINDKAFWDLAEKLVNTDGVALVEIQAPLRKYKNVYTDLWMFPPKILGEDTIVVPRNSFIKALNNLEDEAVKDIAVSLVNILKISLARNTFELEFILEVIRSLGLASTTNIRIQRRRVLAEITMQNTGKGLCSLYKELIGEALGTRVNVEKIGDTECVLSIASPLKQ